MKISCAIFSSRRRCSLIILIYISRKTFVTINLLSNPCTPIPSGNVNPGLHSLMTRMGITREAASVNGESHEGHDHEVHDHEGHDHEGHDHEGHDHEGHDHEGHNHEGHDHARKRRSLETSQKKVRRHAPGT